MIADLEEIVYGYLADDAQLAALGARVVPRTPSTTDEPWIRVRQLDARDVTAPTDHLIDFMVQLDCYAGRNDDQDEAQAQASAIARAARAALVGMPAVALPGVVVSAVQIQGHAHIPDPGFEPERERFVLTAAIWAHS